MELAHYLTPDVVLTDVEETDRDTLLWLMCSAVAASPVRKESPRVTAETLYESVLARETERPTVLGHGLACPHARLDGLQGLGLAVALLRHPVPFGDREDDQIRAVFLLLVPMKRPTLGVKLLAQITRFWSDPPAVEQLMGLHSPEAITSFLLQRVFNIDVPLIASDIMRPARVNIGPGTPLSTVTRLMLENDMESIGVVTDDLAMIGEITCDRLFTLGMPEFFGQLKSVSFISEFDPFDKYFDREGMRVAKDVMSTTFSTVTEQATILEVVFELAVRGFPKVHVVRNGKRVGVIDRVVVLDRILNA